MSANKRAFLFVQYEKSMEQVRKTFPNLGVRMRTFQHKKCCNSPPNCVLMLHEFSAFFFLVACGLHRSDSVRGVAGMNATPEVKAALSVGTDTAGGFALPSVVMPSILEALVPASSLLSAGAGIVPLDSGVRNFTTVAVDSIPKAAWRLEAGQVAQSEPTFRAVRSEPKFLALLFKVSRELLADAPNTNHCNCPSVCSGAGSHRFAR